MRAGGWPACSSRCEQNEEIYAERTVEDVLNGVVRRRRVINGIAVSGANVSVACGEAEG